MFYNFPKVMMARKPFLFRAPLRRRFCNVPKSLWQKIKSHPSIGAKILGVTSCACFAGIITFCMSQKAGFLPPSNYHGSLDVWATGMRGRMQETYGLILMGMLASSLSYYSVWRLGYVARMAAYPKISIVACGSVASCALITSYCQPCDWKKLPVYLLTCGICGVAAAPVISMGVVSCGELFPRLVVCVVTIFGHCTVVAAVAPDENFLWYVLYFGTFLGAINAAVLTHLYFSNIGFLANMLMLVSLSGIGLSTVQKHTDHVLESYNDPGYDPYNKGVILLFEAVHNCYVFFKKKFSNDDKDD